MNRRRLATKDIEKSHSDLQEERRCKTGWSYTHVWWLKIRIAMSTTEIPHTEVRNSDPALGSSVQSTGAGKKSPPNIWL